MEIELPRIFRVLDNLTRVTTEDEVYETALTITYFPATREVGVKYPYRGVLWGVIPVPEVEPVPEEPVPVVPEEPVPEPVPYEPYEPPPTRWKALSTRPFLRPMTVTPLTEPNMIRLGGRIVKASLYPAWGTTTPPSPVAVSLCTTAMDGSWEVQLACPKYMGYILIVEYAGDADFAACHVRMDLPMSTMIEPAVKPPTNLSAVAEETDIYVDWDAVAGAESYVVYRNLNTDLATSIAVANLVDTSYTDYDVLPGRTYYYWVASRDARGDSDPTGPVVATFSESEEPEPLPEPEPEPEPYPLPEPEPEPEPYPLPEPEPSTFVPGDNIKRIMDIVNARLEEIRAKKAEGKWPPWS